MHVLKSMRIVIIVIAHGCRHFHTNIKRTGYLRQSARVRDRSQHPTSKISIMRYESYGNLTSTHTHY